MPITQELDNIIELESVGFSHEQSKTLTKIIERAQIDRHDDLKDFIRNELDSKINSPHNEIDSKINGLHNEITSLDNKINTLRYELKADIASLKTDIAETSKDLLIKLFAIIFGTSGMLFAMLKLFG